MAGKDILVKELVIQIIVATRGFLEDGRGDRARESLSELEEVLRRSISLEERILYLNGIIEQTQVCKAP